MACNVMYVGICIESKPLPHASFNNNKKESSNNNNNKILHSSAIVTQENNNNKKTRDGGKRERDHNKCVTLSVSVFRGDILGALTLN